MRESSMKETAEEHSHSLGNKQGQTLDDEWMEQWLASQLDGASGCLSDNKSV